MGNKRMVEVAVEIKVSTDKAILVSDGSEEIWVPISQVKELENVSDLEEAIANLEVITIPEWLAIQKGLI